MYHLVDIFRFVTIGYLLLLIIQFWQSDTSRKQAFPAIGFCIGVLCYLLVDWEPMQSHVIFLALLAPANATPFFFWLFSKSLFDDDYAFKKWMPWVLVAVLVFFYFSFLANWMDQFNLSESTKTVLSIIQQATALLFVVLAIIEASRNRDSDLVLSRLQFRNAYILCTAILIILTILSDVAFRGGETPLWMEFMQQAVIAGLTFYFALRRMDFKTGFFDEPAATEKTNPKLPVDYLLAKNLIELVEGEKYYRTEGLTIRQLADELEVKEYKLRRTINQHLGFRNFNDFLNSYRIQEACDLLSDPTKKDLTILEIAFKLGYNSLAPFNKAFKSISGTTPTDWRRKNSTRT